MTLKRFLKETAGDLWYMAKCLGILILVFIAWIWDFFREASPREQGFLLGVFFSFSVILVLSVLAVPPMPPTP